MRSKYPARGTNILTFTNHLFFLISRAVLTTPKAPTVSDAPPALWVMPPVGLRTTANMKTDTLRVLWHRAIKRPTALPFASRREPTHVAAANASAREMCMAIDVINAAPEPMDCPPKIRKAARSATAPD